MKWTLSECEIFFSIIVAIATYRTELCSVVGLFTYFPSWDKYLERTRILNDVVSETELTFDSYSVIESATVTKWLNGSGRQLDRT